MHEHMTEQKNPIYQQFNSLLFIHEPAVAFYPFIVTLNGLEGQ